MDKNGQRRGGPVDNRHHAGSPRRGLLHLTAKGHLTARQSLALPQLVTAVGRNPVELIPGVRFEVGEWQSREGLGGIVPGFQPSMGGWLPGVVTPGWDGAGPVARGLQHHRSIPFESGLIGVSCVWYWVEGSLGLSTNGASHPSLG